MRRRAVGRTRWAKLARHVDFYDASAAGATSSARADEASGTSIVATMPCGAFAAKARRAAPPCIAARRARMFDKPTPLPFARASPPPVSATLTFRLCSLARALICIVTGVMWSVVTLYTGFVTSLLALMVVLVLDGLSTGSVFALHTPLLVDSYPPQARVRVLSGYERHNHPPGEIAPLEGGWALFRDRLYADAGYGPSDMQFVQSYDDYPIMVAIQLEDLGFCRKGEVGPFLARHDMAWNGSFPVNTGGGQLSCGQTGAGGGMIGLWEAVCQLRGEAGARQIPNVSRGLVAGYGMVGYGHGLGASAMILEKGT